MNKAKVLVIPEEHEDILRRSNMSINIIKIVLRTKFDLTIAQAQIKDLGR
jgi:hypothetical protein